MQIGPYTIAQPVIAAPMAGVSDKPYRKLCRQYGAAMTVSEMVTSRLDLFQSTKTKFRMDLDGEPEPVTVQIVGTDPQMLAAAARYNVINGAQIIDINMGCPAKKVCKKAAGSALLEDEPLVKRILETVVAAVDVPITVKIRTGATPQQRNAVTIAMIAEQAGVQALTIHGRTRQCKFVGSVEYDTIAQVKDSIHIPVIANGDIDSPQSAKSVKDYTGADAVMIGRAAQGRPWIFQQISDHLSGVEVSNLSCPDIHERALIISQHLKAIHEFYGDRLGVKLARKHIKWYLQHWDHEIDLPTRASITTTEDPRVQRILLEEFLGKSITQLAA